MKGDADLGQDNEQGGVAGEVCFTLPSLLDAAALPALVDSLRQHTATGGAVVLDGQLPERVSTPCIQALLATALDARARGVPFCLRQPSPVLASAIADLGLASGLGQ